MGKSERIISEGCHRLDESLEQIAIVKEELREKLIELDNLLYRPHLDLAFNVINKLQFNRVQNELKPLRKLIAGIPLLDPEIDKGSERPPRGVVIPLRL